MRIKWDSTTLYFSEELAFHTNASWNPPKGNPYCFSLQSRERNAFTVIKSQVRHYNISHEEWKAIKSLADDRNIVIKKADKGSCFVIRDSNDYITDAEKQLSDKDVYKQVSFLKKPCVTKI